MNHKTTLELCAELRIAVERLKAQGLVPPKKKTPFEVLLEWGAAMESAIAPIALAFTKIGEDFNKVLGLPNDKFRH